MDEKVQSDELSSRRLHREDGSAGPPQRRPWKQWDILARADIGAALLTTGAIFFTALSVFEPSGPTGSLPTAYSVIAPLMGVGFFVALITQFLERERHGIARGILIGAAVILVASGIALTPKVGPGFVLLTYWTPALLAVGAALVLLRGHRRADRFAASVRG
ncbi:MAG: hypothetical protein ACT4TC_01755 [Myxococcaceae bacterium]